MKPEWLKCDCNEVNDCKYCGYFYDQIAGAKAAIEYALKEYSKVLFNADGDEREAIETHHLKQILKELEEYHG